MTFHQTQFQDQTFYHFELSKENKITIAKQGGQILSWSCEGVQRLYLSPLNSWNLSKPIRGGIPICFPQFNLNGSLPKHGFARIQEWELSPTHELNEGLLKISLRLASNDRTLAIWPFSFLLTLEIELSMNSLQCRLKVKNLSQDSFKFTTALHSYLAIENLHNISIKGLGNQYFWQNLSTYQTLAPDLIRIYGPYDYVFTSPQNSIYLLSDTSFLKFEQSESFENIVIWNPGKTAIEIEDLPEDDFLKMICIEAAQIQKNITLESNQIWEGYQRITVLNSEVATN